MAVAAVDLAHVDVGGCGCVHDCGCVLQQPVFVPSHIAELPWDRPWQASLLAFSRWIIFLRYLRMPSLLFGVGVTL